MSITRKVSIAIDSLKNTGEERAYNDYSPITISNHRGKMISIKSYDTLQKDTLFDGELLIKAIKACMDLSE